MTTIAAADLQAPELAIVFTDVVDSTDWHRSVGDELARRMWNAHDRAGRQLLRRWGGQEVGRTDGFLILFGHCRDALGFAWDYHAALAKLEHPFSARVGVHWGPVRQRPNPPEDVAAGAVPFDVDGLAVPAAARVMSVAQGGQTLLSRAALDALEPAAGSARQVTPLGHWRLKGLDEPVELFDVSPSGTAVVPPPDGAKVYRVVQSQGAWLPVRAVPNNLGAEIDPFVGRREALRELAQAFHDGARLVTLLGIGGIGKTRLARRYARSWLGDFPGGAWFCDLSTARAVDGIALAVAQALQVPLGGLDPVEQLASALRARGECLLVLDNFEQVASCAPATVGLWLAAAPQLHVLVTSRELLGLPGERVQVLEPLSVDEAVELYQHRLHDAGLGSPLGELDRAALPQLAVMLDQLPLAIELSAARVRTLGPVEQLRRIGERFRLLAVRGGRHDRQATIRSTLDWSWDLLNPAERAVLAQLAVFDGGFTLEAAEAVCRVPDDGADTWIGDLLQSLVEKSLVRRPDLHRFELLRTVQDYGLQRLGDGGAEVRLRHARHFAALSDTPLMADRGAELDNLVSACRWASAEKAATESAEASLNDLAVALLVRAWSVLRLTGPFRAALALAEPLRVRPRLAPAAAARVWHVLGAAHGLLGDAELARNCIKAGIRWAQEAGDTTLKANLLAITADQDIRSGRVVEGEALLREARATGVSDDAVELVLASTEGQAAQARGAHAQARACFEAALTIARRLGDRRWEGGIQGNLGRLAIVTGQRSQAHAHLADSLRCAVALGDRQWEGNAHCNLGFLLFEQGELAAASAHLSQALELARQLGHRWLEATALCNLGLVLGAQGAHAEAVQCLESAVLTAHDLQAPAAEGQFRGYLAVALADAGDGAAALAEFERAERLLPATEQPHDHALLLGQRAAVRAALGQTEEALADLQAASALASALSLADDSELARTLERTRCLLS